MLNIFGRQISLSVLIAFIGSLLTLAVGVVTMAANNWGQSDPGSYLLTVAGAVSTAVTAGIHSWDTMPSNIPTPGK
jgi:hypothetical protein